MSMSHALAALAAMWAQPGGTRDLVYTVDGSVVFDTLGWRFTCTGYVPHFMQCETRRQVGPARLDVLASSTDIRFTLRGGCRGRDPVSSATLVARPRLDVAEISRAIDGLFVAQYRGCRNPMTWEQLRLANQVVYFMYRLTRP
jgi:hypothetical protein